MPVTVLYGDEGFLLSQEIKAIRAKTLTPGLEALSHKQLKDPEIYELTEQLAAVSFNLGGQTLIEVRNFWPLEKKAAGTDEKLLEALQETIESLDPNKHVVFIGEKIDRKIKFPKWLTARKDVVTIQHKQLSFWETDKAVQFLMQYARKENVQLAPKAAELLVEHMGVALQPLTNEIGKLALYAAGKTITPEHVATLSNHNDNTFRMLEYWLKGRERGEIFAILDELLLRQHPVQLFALTQTYLNNAYRLRLWREAGMSEAAIAERLKKHPFKIKKDLQEFAPVPMTRLAKLKEQTLDLEWKAKTGQVNDRLAFEMLMSA